MELAKVGNEKYVFQRKIESGDFSIFDSKIDCKTLFSLFLIPDNRGMAYHNNYTTFRSFLIYLNNNSNTDNPEESITKWENIKNIGADLSLIIDDFSQYDYFQHLNNEKMKSIGVNLSNFNTLLNFGFFKKSEFIGNHILNEAFNVVDLSKTPPVYAINNLLSRPKLLNNYLNILKERYPYTDLEFAIHFLNFNEIFDKNTLKHFIKNNLKKPDEFTYNLIAQIFLHFEEKDIYSLLENLDLNIKDMSKNIIFTMLDNEKNSKKEKTHLFLDYLKLKNITLEHLKLSDFKTHLDDKKFIFHLLNNQLQYKCDFKEYIYELNTENINKNSEIVIFLNKNNLWHITEKDNNNISYIDYYNSRFNNIDEQTRQGLIRNPERLKRNVVSDFVYSFKYLSPTFKDLHFLNDIHQDFFILFMRETLKVDFIDKKLFDDYFNNNNIINSLFNIIKEVDEDKKFKFHRLEDIHPKYLLQDEKQYLKILNDISSKDIEKKFGETSSITLCASLLIGNQDQKFIYKYLEKHCQLFLDLSFDYLKKEGTIDISSFKTMTNLIYTLNRSVLFKDTNIHMTYKNIIGSEYLIRSHYLHTSQIKEFEDFFKKLNKDYLHKYVAYEKSTISESFTEDVNIKNKIKRL